MIEIKDIHRSFGSLRVLRGIDVTIKSGEIVSIVGPSGAGKTTLLQIAGTLDRPDSGTVFYDGVDVLSLSEKKLSAFRNRNIGFVFQFHQWGETACLGGSCLGQQACRDFCRRAVRKSRH